MSVLNNKGRESTGNVFSLVRLLSKNKNGLKICHINSQSLGGGKIDEFRNIFEESGVDIVCVSETWFKPDMPDNLYQLKGYKILRADRISHAGGAAIFIKSNIHHNIILKSPNDSDMEYLFIEISAADSKILIATVYRPKKPLLLQL